jgi:hypothetical protein
LFLLELYLKIRVLNKTKQIKTKQKNLILRSISAYGAIEKICMLREYGVLKK